MTSDPLPINDTLIIPASDLSFEFARSSGPGGQHVNTSDTQVRLRFALDATEALPEDVKNRIRAARGGQLTSEGELLLSCSSHRSRHRNVGEVRARLQMIILEALTPPKPRKKTRPTRGSVRRRLDAKRRQSDKKKMRKNPDY